MADASPSDDGSEDCFKPPLIPTEVHCLHCGEEYQSYLIEYRPRSPALGNGFWCCPTPGCDGAGFLFDIFPTDPDWRNEVGERVGWFNDGEDEFEEDDQSSDDPNEEEPWFILTGPANDEETEWNEDFYEAMDAEERRAREERIARRDKPHGDPPRDQPKPSNDANDDDIPF